MPDTDFHFLSWVRSGLAAALAQPDTFGEAQPSVATATLGVTVGARPEPVTQAVALRGPGDVIGISRSQVVRTDPIDGSVGVEPNYFAQIEFDRPDLPWLFTPAAPAGDRLRPWLADLAADGRPTGAVAHNGILRAVYALATGWDMQGPPQHKLRNACAHLFALAPDGTPSVVEVNIRLDAA